jgi:hypothetical protein
MPFHSYGIEARLRDKLYDNRSGRDVCLPRSSYGGIFELKRTITRDKNEQKY